MIRGALAQRPAGRGKANTTIVWRSHTLSREGVATRIAARRFVSDNTMQSVQTKSYIGTNLTEVGIQKHIYRVEVTSGCQMIHQVSSK